VDGLGLGVEGGYALRNHVFIGGNFTYFAQTFGGFVFEAQGGYEIPLRVPVLIRPYGGIGIEHVNSYTICGNPALSLSCTSTGTDGNAFVFSIGAEGQYFFTRNWFAGVDFRIDLSTAADYTTFNAFGVGGYKF
jgi:hypothetical protein